MTDLTDESVKALLDGATPGPWRYDRTNGSPTTGEHMIAGAKPGYLAEVRDCGSGDVRANAHLIAAAPDLARALLDARAELAQARAEAQAAHEGGMDAAADKILDWLAKAVGAKEYTACDGSETWDGDVQGTIYAILKAGNVYDEEDGRVAKLADTDAAVALVVERAATEVSLNAWRHEGEDAYSKGMDAGARHQAQVIYNAIRALAPADGLAAVKALRVEIADLKMNMDADLRTMVREGQQLRTLAAELAVAQQREAGLVAAMEIIAKQKRTDELDTEHDVEMADFEGGYDAAINVARAALATQEAKNG